MGIGKNKPNWLEFDYIPGFRSLQDPVPHYRGEPAVPPSPAPKPLRHPSGGVR